MTGGRCFVALAIVVAVASACSGAQTPSPSPTSGAPLTTAGLRLTLIDSLGPLWHCDPDFWPVAREDEAALAVQRFDEVRADADAFANIAAYLQFDPSSEATDAEKLAIYRLWKQLNAIQLEPVENRRYRFDYLNMPAQGEIEGRRTTGTIGEQGAIEVEQQAPAGEPVCPICLARGTRIAAPDGDVPVEDIRVGTRIWSLDRAGHRVVATVVLVGSTPVPASHDVIRLVLDDGRIVRASPGHPLADGRSFASLRSGDRIDGARAVTATHERYDGGTTFDLLPDAPTGIYFADGVPLGSTLGGSIAARLQSGP
jgi:hypothetical protein